MTFAPLPGSGAKTKKPGRNYKAVFFGEKTDDFRKMRWHAQKIRQK